MSNFSAALSAAIQNDSTIGPLITGVISGRNFDLQDTKLSTSPYACIMVSDLPSHEKPFLGGVNGKETGQIEVRCISKSSETKAKDLASACKTLFRATKTLSWDASTLPFLVTGWMQTPDMADDLSFWIEILTIDYMAVT